MNKQSSSIKQNIAYNSAYNILTIIIPLILSPYISRTLGVEGIGLYSFTFVVANYFKRFAMLGMEKYGNRQIALVKDQDKDKNKTFWCLYKVQLVCASLSLFIYCLYLLYFDTKGMPSLLQGLFVLSSAFDVGWYFFGNEIFKTIVIISSSCKIVYLIFTFIFINSPNDLNGYIFLTSLSYLIPNFLLFILAFRKEPFTKNTFCDIFTVFKGTLLLFIPVVAVTIYKSMDKLMLGVLCSTTYENGLYENAEKVLHVPIALIASVSSVLMPRMTKLYRDNEVVKASEYILMSIKYAAFMSVACSSGLAGVAGIFSVVYWGEAFSECALLLRLFSITIPVMCFAEIIRTQYIIPQKHDKVYINAVCSGAIVNLVLNYFLIVNFGAVGAVIGTIMAETTVCAYQAYKVKNDLFIKRYCFEFFKYVPLGVLTSCVLFFIGQNLEPTILNLLFMIIVGGSCICILSLIQMFYMDRILYEMIISYVKRCLKIKQI